MSQSTCNRTPEIEEIDPIYISEDIAMQHISHLIRNLLEIIDNDSE